MDPQLAVNAIVSLLQVNLTNSLLYIVFGHLRGTQVLDLVLFAPVEDCVEHFRRLQVELNRWSFHLNLYHPL